ncbi:MAG TPA: ribosomal protein S18-alanine N-acetyltransferase [Bacillota bacterium]|nr:ribosomal protein S18-alanine N-acetyltransferase [Bacillota bacterium]
MAHLNIRKMEITDLEEVQEVEVLSFTNPWPKEILHQELVDNQYAHYFVIELAGQIIGYVGLWIVLDDAQITNIAISPAYRGNRYGEKLFAYACQQAQWQGVKRLSLEVRASNTVAQRMYRKFGLVPGGVRKNYYTDNHEDAIVMWVNLQ